jgi:hypothetical protein
MRRRTCFSLIGLVAGLATFGGASAGAPSYRVSLQQLQDVLAQRFPVRYPVAGLFDVTLDVPRLFLLADLNRLGAGLPLRAAGPALRRSHGGQIDVDFNLRYEPADQTIRAQRLRVERLQVDGLTGEAQALLERSAADFARQALFEVVLHRLRPQELALADAMGLEPGPINVTLDGLVIEFVNKTPRPPR